MWLLSLRDIALFAAGLGTLLFQVVHQGEVQPPLVILSAVMMGLPATIARQRLESALQEPPEPVQMDPLDKLRQRYLTTGMDTIDFILEVDAYPQQPSDLSEVFDEGLSKRSEALSKAQYDTYLVLKKKGLPIPEDLKVVCECDGAGWVDEKHLLPNGAVWISDGQAWINNRGRATMLVAPPKPSDAAWSANPNHEVWRGS